MPASPMARRMDCTFWMCCGAFGAVEQDVVPVGGIEVFNGFKLEPGGFNLLAQGDQLGGGPEFVWVAGDAPGLVFASCGLVLRGVGFALPEVVHQVNNDVRATGLNGEGVVLVVQHVPVKAQTEFHDFSQRQFNSGGAGEHRVRGRMPWHFVSEVH